VFGSTAIAVFLYHLASILRKQHTPEREAPKPIPEEAAPVVSHTGPIDFGSPRKSQAFNKAFAQSSDEYAEVFNRIDVNGEGIVSKSSIVDVLKSTAALRVLADSIDDPIATAVNRIPSADPEFVTVDEWNNFVDRIVSHPRSRKSKEMRYSLAPEDFRTIIDVVD
jgi:hypothetical protein